MILDDDDDDDDGGDDDNDDNDARAELYAVCAREKKTFTIHIDSNISTYLYILMYVRDT